jgi:SAM-dependent methyltransferase
MGFCKLADVQDWESPEFQATETLLKLNGRKTRKTWEHIHVYSSLQRLGLLNPTTRILGLGVGHECLVYAFTNVCQEVVATDLYHSSEWYMAAMSPEEVYTRNPFPYQRDRLIVQHMDMTQLDYPDNSFDLVWSCGSIEHMNSFADLHRVYQEVHRVLKPGGIAALTTDYNLSSNADISADTYRPLYEPNALFIDPYWLITWLTGDRPLVTGFHLLDPLDLFISNTPANQPQPRREPRSTLAVQTHDIALTSIAFFLQKTGEFSQPYNSAWLPESLHLYLQACEHIQENKLGQAEKLLNQVLQTNTLPPRLQVATTHRLIQILEPQKRRQELISICQNSLPVSAIPNSNFDN